MIKPMIDDATKSKSKSKSKEKEDYSIYGSPSAIHDSISLDVIGYPFDTALPAIDTIS